MSANEADKIQKILSRVSDMIGYGNYKQAYVLIRRLKVQNNYIEVNLASPLIEIGSGLKDINLIRKGSKRCQS